MSEVNGEALKPAGFNATVSEENGELCIAMPVRRRWPLFIFFTVWLAAWVCGGLFALLGLVVLLSLLVIGEPDWPKLGFLMAWLVGWAVGAVLGVYWWLLMAGGREVLRVSEDALMMIREASRYARAQRFDLCDVSDLRVFPSFWTLSRFLRAGAEHWYRTGGQIAFDHQGRTYRIGTEVDEAEAEHLVGLILRRFPSLAPKGKP